MNLIFYRIAYAWFEHACATSPSSTQSLKLESMHKLAMIARKHGIYISNIQSGNLNSFTLSEEIKLLLDNISRYSSTFSNSVARYEVFSSFLIIPCQSILANIPPDFQKGTSFIDALATSIKDLIINSHDILPSLSNNILEIRLDPDLKYLPDQYTFGFQTNENLQINHEIQTLFLNKAKNLHQR